MSISKTGDKNYNFGIFGSLNKSAIPVIQYSKKGEFIAKYSCAVEAKREIGVDNCSISKACKGTLKTAGGYIWEFADIKNNFNT